MDRSTVTRKLNQCSFSSCEERRRLRRLKEVTFEGSLKMGGVAGDFRSLNLSR